MLTDQQLDRYARHIVLRDVGGAGQAKLLDAHIILIGAGGIGCPAAIYLAAAGVGKITVVDDDKVSLSNLQRQILYGEGDIDTPKVTAMGASVARINPDVDFTGLERRIDADSNAEMLSGADAVIDGSDNFTTRLLVNDLCINAQVPLVSAAIGQFHGQIGTFAGWKEDAPCYRCFVGDAHDPEDCDDCSEVGVLGAMCGMMGSFAAMEAIRIITGFGEDAGNTAGAKLHIFDGLKPSMRTITLPKDNDCSSCG